MPPLPVVAGVARYDFLQKVGDDLHVLNRIFMSCTSGFTFAAAALEAGHAATAWGSTIAGWQTTDVALEEVTVTDLNSMSGAVGSVGSTVVGGQTPPAVPGSVALVVDHQIARRYRGGKPKTFVAGVRAQFLHNEQEWDGTFIAGTGATWDAFIADIVTGTHIAATEQVSVSYYEGFTVVISPTTGRARNVAKLRVGGPVTDPILASNGNVRPGSQRRRGMLS